MITQYGIRMAMGGSALSHFSIYMSFSHPAPLPTGAMLRSSVMLVPCAVSAVIQ